jgi:hypothetical protein
MGLEFSVSAVVFRPGGLLATEVRPSTTT